MVEEAEALGRRAGVVEKEEEEVDEDRVEFSTCVYHRNSLARRILPSQGVPEFYSGRNEYAEKQLLSEMTFYESPLCTSSRDDGTPSLPPFRQRSRVQTAIGLAGCRDSGWTTTATLEGAAIVHHSSS